MRKRLAKSNASSTAAKLKRVKITLGKESVSAWDAFIVLAFMVEALSDD